MTRFIFPHSHAFPGGLVVVENDGRDAVNCLVEFGDGVTVIAEWHPAGETIHLAVPAYRTAKGTKVAPRNWTLGRRNDGTWRLERAPYL